MTHCLYSQWHIITLHETALQVQYSADHTAHSIPAQKSYTHQNSSSISSKCKGLTQSNQPTLYYTLHHGIWHSIIKSHQSSYLSTWNTLLSAIFSQSKVTTLLPQSGATTQPCLANSKQTHCLPQYIAGHACSNCFYMWIGTNIYCKTSSLAFSWYPLLTLKMIQSLNGVVSIHTKER
jgi:hypothetical protein